MKKALASLAVCGILLTVSGYYGKHFLQRKQLLVAQQPHATESTQQETEPTPAASQDSEQLVIVAGPLAQWMQNGKPQKQETPEKQASAPQGQTQENVSEDRGSQKLFTGDHIVRSSTTTTGVVVQKIFNVATDQNVAFEIPPHIVNPQLHGRYRAFVRQAGGQTSNASADVDFRLMTQQQYTDFLNGRPGDALFAVDAAHDQAVTLSLPPSMDEPVKYYLVFRGSGSAENVVEANFKVDF